MLANLIEGNYAGAAADHGCQRQRTFDGGGRAGCARITLGG
jgi:hypothetical protein